MAFKTWGEVKEYVEEEEVADLKILVKLIDNYGVQTVLDVANTTVDPRYADVTLSTAHKGKGLEFDSVKLAADFREPEADPETGEKKVSPGEFRLAYVAVTRAQNRLDCSSIKWVDEWMPLEDKPLNEPLSNHPEAVA